MKAGRNAFLSGKSLVPVAQANFQKGGRRVNVVGLVHADVDAAAIFDTPH